MADTLDELKQYECMADVKHKTITVQGQKVLYYTKEYENCSENEALESMKAEILNGDIEPDNIDYEIVDHWVNRL